MKLRDILTTSEEDSRCSQCAQCGRGILADQPLFSLEAEDTGAVLGFYHAYCALGAVRTAETHPGPTALYMTTLTNPEAN